MMLKLKRLADNLAMDVLEKSDDPFLLNEASDLKKIYQVNREGRREII